MTRLCESTLTILITARLFASNAQAAFYFFDSDGVTTTATGFAANTSPFLWQANSVVLRLNTNTGTPGTYPGGNHTLQFEPINGGSGGVLNLAFSPTVTNISAKISSVRTSDDGGSNVINLKGGTTTLESTTGLTIEAVMQVNAGISMTGSNDITFNRANTYNGSTTQSNARLILGVTDAIPIRSTYSLTGKIRSRN